MLRQRALLAYLLDHGVLFITFDSSDMHLTLGDPGS